MKFTNKDNLKLDSNFTTQNLNKNYNNNDLEKPKGLSFYDFVAAFVMLALMITIFVPVIYIRNEIYYISRDIEELRVKHSVLVEENKDLENKIESLKFRYEIIDPLSVEFEDE